MSDDIRLRELQNALREKMASNKTIADSFKVEDGTVVVSAEQKSAFDRNMSDIREIKSLIEGIENMRDAEKWASAPASESVAQSSAAKPVHESREMNFKTVGEAFLSSDEFKALASGRNGANMVAPYVYNVKDVFTGMPTGPASPLSSVEQFGQFQRDPMVVAPTRTRRVRDLFPKRTTNAAVIEYFRQIGYTSPAGMTPPANNAAPVAERSGSPAVFTTKPQSGLKFTGHQAPVRTLAHWEAAHRNVLADEPQLRSIIDNELMYGLRLLEDTQILNGDGTGENLQGVLQTSDIQTYSWSSGAVGDLKADAIRRAATLSFLAYYEPTGVVMHPNDWEDVELSKDDNGQYLVAVSVALGGQPRLWRIPVVDTPAIAEGTALVGAFGTAAQIYDREQASIRISEQHADFFVRNAIVILAEQRLALAVKRPEAFVKVTFNSAPA